MVSKRDEKLVLWPLYFDRAVPRPWRRIPKALAVESPTAEEVAKAAQSLRLKPILETEPRHPGRWYATGGRVLVDIRGSKSVLVRQIGEALAELRKAAPPAKAGR